MKGPFAWLLGGFSALLLAFLLAPVVIVLILSFSSAKFLRFPPPGFSLQWYESFLSSPSWTNAALTSLAVGFATMILSVLLGTPAAIGLSRSNFPGKKLISALILSPVIVPGIVVAIGFYYGYAAYRMIGSPLALTVAHTCLAVPFVVVTVGASLAGLDPRLEQAARNLGAGPFAAFWQVTMPIIRPGILSGAVFAFITSFDELLVALFLSGNSAVTLPRRMWDQLRFELDPTIAAASSLLIVATVALMLTSEMLRRRTERLRGSS